MKKTFFAIILAVIVTFTTAIGLCVQALNSTQVAAFSSGMRIVVDAGHGGMDYLMFKEFFKAVLNGEEMPVDVYDAAAWMCITALSEQSIATGGTPQPVPDFTRGKWIKRSAKDVTAFPEICNRK